MRRLRITTLLIAIVMTLGLQTSYAADRIDNYTYHPPIVDEIFRGLVAPVRGGAINNSSKTGSFGVIAAITNCEFLDNEAKYGGAINNFTTAELGPVSNSSFYRNTANANGGAIYSDGIFSSVVSCVFSSNAANGSTSGSGYGGAIYSDLNSTSNYLTILNSSFDDNKAVHKGGAIAHMRGNLNIVAKDGVSVFKDNLQSNKPNDIYMGGSKQILNISAYYADDYVTLNSGIDSKNSNLIININGPTATSGANGNGKVYLNGDSGSSSNRPDYNLFGGVFSLSTNDDDYVNMNTVYADKVKVVENTVLGFDINIDDVSRDFDSFNFSSITGSGKMLFFADSFNILGTFDEDSESMTATLLNSSSSFRKYLQMYDDKGRKVNIVYKYDNFDKPVYKIRLTSEGKFIISVPQYIDEDTNPLAYAVNYLYNSEDVQRMYQLDVKKNITIDSWEDLPDDNKDLKPRNIQRPIDLYIVGKNKTITAEDNLIGMAINDSYKTLDVQKVTFIGFKTAIENNSGNVKLASTGFKENVNEEDNGGAIRNNEGIMDITGTKKSNKTLFYNNEGINGGAIYNLGALKIDYGTFGANATKKTDYKNKALLGGAIYNLQSDVVSGGEKIANLVVTNSNFVDNTAVNGGAIYNAYAEGETDNPVSVNANFRRNTAVGAGEDESIGNGGAVYNTGYLKTTGSIFGKSGKKAEGNTAINGGAVMNTEGGKFESENTSYYYNIATGSKNAQGTVTAYGKGGAVYNTTGSTATIKGGTFSANQADYGGAIFNDADVDDDNFTRLILDSYTNPSNQKIIVTTFSKNISNSGMGGAIYNLGTIAPFDESIVEKDLPVAGNFTSNKATLAPQTYDKVTKAEMYTIGNSPYGGAVYNEGTLELNQANFSSNSANANVTVNTLGYEEFEKYGTAKVTKQTGKGGAIYSNSSNPLYIANSQFTKNTSAEAGGGICSENEDALVSIINSEFTSNSTKSTITTVRTITRENGKTLKKPKKETIKTTAGQGGAIYSDGAVEINNKDSKYGAFIKRVDPTDEESPYSQSATVFTSNSADDGGAVYTNKTADVNHATFSKNNAAGNGGAVYAGDDVTVTNAAFTNNKSTDNGGAIYTKGDVFVNIKDYTTLPYDYTPLDQTVSFSGNTSTNGGAIYAEGNVYVKDATFTSNKASKGKGGAVYADGNIKVVNTDFTKNSADYGGALYVAPGKTAYLVNSSFTNNTASKAGGAIYADEGSTIYISAYSKDVVISGNKAGKSANSIFLADGADVYIYAHKTQDTHGREIKYSVTLSDGVTGNPGENTNLYLFGLGDLYITKNITNLSIHDEVSRGENPEIEEASKDTITGETFGMGMSPSFGGTINISDEALFENTSMSLSGRSSLNIANNNVGTLEFNKLSLADDTTTNISIDADLKNAKADKITAQTREGTGVLNVSALNLTSDSVKSVTLNLGEDSEVSSMTATKAESAQATYKLKTLVDENGHLMAKAYGQKVKPAVVSAPVAAQIGGYLTQVNSYDQAFTNLDMEMLLTREEREGVNANKFAYNGADYGYENGINRDSKGLWDRAYATFERVRLTSGPTVGNIAYGNFFGGDMGKKELRNGWKRQFSAYIGYNGSTQDFDRQSIDQNGGTLGIMETWYKGNFFTALTANVSGNFADASTDIGKERMAMLMAGVASKTGYNWELARGKFIIQPSILLSYSFVHTFAHDNGLGNRVSSSPLNAIQVAPGIKFIANLKNGWQPYIGINMRWNIMDKTSFNLQDVNIPDMSIRPYVEYGIGVQKRWGERFTGYGQAMMRNGGRNGVMLSVGFRWAIGK